VRGDDHLLFEHCGSGPTKPENRIDSCPIIRASASEEHRCEVTTTEGVRLHYQARSAPEGADGICIDFADECCDVSGRALPFVT